MKKRTKSKNKQRDGYVYHVLGTTPFGSKAALREITFIWIGYSFQYKILLSLGAAKFVEYKLQYKKHYLN